MTWNNRKVLIIGGAGYIGSVLTKHLLKHGASVRCLDLLLYNNKIVVEPFLSNPKYEFMHGDLADADQVNAALEGVEDVILLAGLVGDPITKKYPQESARINDKGYADLVDALDGRGLNKVVFVSTCSNYGLIEGDQLAGEGFDLNPLSLYAKSKVAVEKRILGLEGKVDYSPTILRFATAFGLSPRMRFDLTVSEFTRDMFIGDELVVYDAETWRPYCHVGDFSRVIHMVLEAPAEDVGFEVFNAGGEVNNFTKKMIVDTILKELPDAEVRFQEHGSDPRNYRVDFSKIRERLGFEPRYMVADGIRELIDSLRRGNFTDIEQNANFYGNYEIDY